MFFCWLSAAKGGRVVAGNSIPCNALHHSVARFLPSSYRVVPQSAAMQVHGVFAPKVCCLRCDLVIVVYQLHMRRPLSVARSREHYLFDPFSIMVLSRIELLEPKFGITYEVVGV